MYTLVSSWEQENCIESEVVLFLKTKEIENSFWVCQPKIDGAKQNLDGLPSKVKISHWGLGSLVLKHVHFPKTQSMVYCLHVGRLEHKKTKNIYIECHQKPLNPSWWFGLYMSGKCQTAMLLSTGWSTLNLFKL